MMGGFSVVVDGISADWLPARTPKGVSLVEMLILHRNETLSRHRLYQELWGADAGTECNPALKTLVCRTRRHLNLVAEGLGNCIATARNGYRWQDAPEVTVDVIGVQALFSELKLSLAPQRRLALTRQLIACYRGDLFLNGLFESGASLSAWLHREYLDAIERCLRDLRAADDYETVCAVTAAAIRVDSLDDGLSIAHMRALLALNRPREARAEYLRITQALRRELGNRPSAELQRMDHAIAEAERRPAKTH